MEICRLCLSTTSHNIEVINNQELISRISDCVSIQISPRDRNSQYVCCDCFEKIDNWYKFKLMCLKSNMFFVDQLPTKVEKQSNSAIMKTADVDCKSHLSNLDKNDEVIICEQSGEKLKGKPETIIDEVYNCDFCSRNFEFYTDYLDHQNEHDGEVVFNCEKCNLDFSTKLDLVNHEKSHKSPCHICGTLIQKQSMKLHLNKHTDKFKCTYCLLTFTCGPLLNEHITARHMKLKIHCCDFCGKDFATKSSLILHLKTHSEKREYQCNKCDYAGRTSISLKIHMSKHENNTCICEYCSKIFKSIRNLNDHLRRVHCSKKKHSCNYCGMKFALRYLLEIHLRTHSGIHPYECIKCPKTFARSDGLKEHMKTHNRSEVFVCTICSKRFLTKRGIKRHSTSHV